VILLEQIGSGLPGLIAAKRPHARPGAAAPPIAAGWPAA
jgi:hypothetical protein